MAMCDRSSGRRHLSRQTDEALALRVTGLRRQRLTGAQIALETDISMTTVSRILNRAGLSRIRDIAPAEPVIRYEYRKPGGLIHLDIKRPFRIDLVGHRAIGTGNLPSPGQGVSALAQTGLERHGENARLRTSISGLDWIDRSRSKFRATSIMSVSNRNGVSNWNPAVRVPTATGSAEKFTKPEVGSTDQPEAGQDTAGGRRLTPTLMTDCALFGLPMPTSAAVKPVPVNTSIDQVQVPPPRLIDTTFDTAPPAVLVMAGLA